MLSPKLRHRWHTLEPALQSRMLARLSLTPRNVERLLTDERIFMTIPIDDRRLLGQVLGLTETEHWIVRSSGEATTAPSISLADAEEGAKRLLADLVGRRLQPPIDVEALARKMGAEIAIQRMKPDGRLAYRDGREYVLVSSNASRARQRFTIAHELGHLWLRDNQPGCARLTPREEERFCDRFAAALLMPRDWVTATATSKGQDLRSLNLLASEAQTSKSAMLARLKGLQVWRLSLVRFNREAGRWRLQGATALPGRLRGKIGSAPDTGGVLQEAVRRGGTVDLPLPLTTDGRTVHDYRAEIQAARRNAVALVDFLHECDSSSAYCPEDKEWVEMLATCVVTLEDGTTAVRGRCPDCGSQLMKIGARDAS